MLTKNRYVSVKINASEMKQRSKELSFLFELSNFFSSARGLNNLLSGALSRVLKYFELEAGRIYLIDEDKDYLSLAANQGIDPKGFEKIAINVGFTGKAARTKSFIAQYVSELEDKERAAILKSRGFKIVICVPLIWMDKVEGVMNLASSKIVQLDEEKIDLFTTVGNQIAVATNNARLYDDLLDTIQILKERKEMIKLFAYSITHDLKSPVSGIYGLTRRLKEKYQDSLDEKGNEYCDRIMKASEQVVTLVEDINSYIVSKEVPLNLEKIRVTEITEEIRKEFADILEKRRIKWSEPDLLPEIIADKVALLRVFRNFVENALKYGGNSMLTIEIGYGQDKAFHIFSVKDDGVEINAADREKIFERFHRNEASRGTTGTGLGLAIVKEIAEKHRGDAWVDSNEGEGTTFYMSISKDLDNEINKQQYDNDIDSLVLSPEARNNQSSLEYPR